MVLILNHTQTLSAVVQFRPPSGHTHYLLKLLSTAEIHVLAKPSAVLTPIHTAEALAGLQPSVADNRLRR